MSASCTQYAYSKAPKCGFAILTNRNVTFITHIVPQSSLRSIYLNSAYSWAMGIEWNQILIFKLEHNQCNMFLFILLILKVNTKSCIINTWATKSLWPVSNVVLLPCQTQFINYKYTRIHCKSSPNCFLFCKFSFLQQLF